MAEKFFTELEVIRSGAVLKEYTQTDFITISPAPAIGKVKFSIVKQGTAGKDHVDFYLNMEAFRLLCQDLSSAAGIKRLSESSDHQYPDAFKFTSGTDGSKHLNIGGGRKGIRIQIQVKDGQKWDNRMVIVSYDALQSMAFRFRLVMGLIPATHYYGSLVDAFWEGEEQRAKYYRNSYDEAGDGDYTPAEPTAPVQGQPKAETKPEAAGETKAVKPEPEICTYMVQTMGPVKHDSKQDVFYCPVKTSDGVLNLCFTPSSLPAMGDKWGMFQERAANGVKVRIKGVLYGKNLKFIALA